MSNMLYGKTKYFQLPQAVIHDQMLSTMSEAEIKLAVGVFFKMQKHSKTELLIDNPELHKLTGLSPNSIARARVKLKEFGLLTFRRGAKGSYIYALCLPDENEGIAYEGKQPRRYRNDLANLEPSQYQQYYEHRLAAKLFVPSANGFEAQCPFHSDRKPSMSINVEKGVWNCHSCKAKGGVIHFEQKFSNCEKGQASKNIAEILGFRVSNLEPESVYQYQDESGNVLYECVRFPGKQFSHCRINQASRG